MSECWQGFAVGPLCQLMESVRHNREDAFLTPFVTS